MKPPAPEPSDGPVSLGDESDFSLVLGGPLFQLLRRAHTSDDPMMMRANASPSSLFVWLPLLLLVTRSNIRVEHRGRPPQVDLSYLRGNEGNHEPDNR
jgi:hypothetical protein